MEKFGTNSAVHAYSSGQRHNIGFLAVDRIAGDHGFAPWRSKFQGEVSEGRLGAEKVVAHPPMVSGLGVLAEDRVRPLAEEAVADYIAGMMDRYAMKAHEALRG